MTPALTLLFDLPVDAGLARVGARSKGGKDRIERESQAFHQRLRDGYLELAAAEPQRFAVLDATQSVDAVEAAVWDAVRTRLITDYRT